MGTTYRMEYIIYYIPKLAFIVEIYTYILFIQ
jgi:hypothetical protein